MFEDYSLTLVLLEHMYVDWTLSLRRARVGALPPEKAFCRLFSVLLNRAYFVQCIGLHCLSVVDFFLLWRQIS